MKTLKVKPKYSFNGKIGRNDEFRVLCSILNSDSREAEIAESDYFRLKSASEKSVPIESTGLNHSKGHIRLAVKETTDQEATLISSRNEELKINFQRNLISIL